MRIDLTGHTALVCGGSQGIGFAAAHELAALGAKIILLSRNAEKLKKAAAELPGNGHSYLAVDLGNIADVERQVGGLVKETIVDIVINNSGGPKPSTAIDADLNAFEKGFKEHVLAAQKIAQLVVPGMKKKSYGRIINIISTSVKVPIPNLMVSNTVRGAMANWSKTMSYELGPFGITVNNVLPGFTITGRLQDLIKNAADKAGSTVEKTESDWKNTIPARRFAEAREVGEAIAFLASPAGSYISGINLPVDGGRTPSL